MYKIAKPLFMHCQSPMHAGSGSDLGIVDLPIQRERHTSFPKIESSSLKGALREIFEEEREIDFDGKKIKVKDGVKLSFGPESGDSHAGAIGFTDARLLLFPVKSLKGIFAWITCPMVLERFYDEMTSLITPAFTDTDLGIKRTEISALEGKISNTAMTVEGKVILEEFAIKVDDDNNKIKEFAKKLASILNTPTVENKLVVISNDTFSHFVNLSTEIVTRIKIGNETGTVAEGPFNEEYLPTESIMYSLVLASPIFQEKGKKDIFETDDKMDEVDKLLSYFHNGLKDIIQIGGNATLGKGLVRMVKSHIKTKKDKKS